MLKTTENQLTLKYHVSKHREILNNELIAAGYDIAYNLETSSGYSLLVSKDESPIDVPLDIDIDIEDENLEYIQLEYTNLYCYQFSTEDIQALAELYIYMIQNYVTSYPDDLDIDIDDILKPGQLAEWIDAYLN